MAKKQTTQASLQFGTLHIAKDNHVKKLGLMYVPWNKLKILEGFNDREDYGSTSDMNELAESIYQVGPKVPLKGYKDGDNYVVIVGHRRHRAGEIVFKEYKKNIIFPMQLYPPGTSKQDMLLDTLLTNSGKDLTPLEKASTVSKLIEAKVTTKDIASSLGGVSEVYVKNLERLWTIPDEAKKLIRDGVVSATLVMQYLKQKSVNWEEFITEVLKLVEKADQAPKKRKGTKKKAAKVTAKTASKGKLNSLKEFKRFVKQNPDTFENKNKQAAFDFMVQVLKNEVNYVDILEFFTGKS